MLVILFVFVQLTPLNCVVVIEAPVVLVRVENAILPVKGDLADVICVYKECLIV